MTDSVKNTPQMTFTPPKVGVVATPPKISGGISKDTLEIINTKVPDELRNTVIKKKKSPIDIINYMWLAIGALSAIVAGNEFLKLIKKH